MHQDFQIYMVSVEWESENTIRRFTPSTCPLEPSDFVDDTYRYDAVIYNKVDKDYYQIALKTKNYPLLFSNDDTFGVSLFAIPDTDYWIIKGEWTISATNKRYHHCPSINTVGKLLLSINGKRIEIDLNPNIEDFDFESLKNDFVGDLWNLLTSNKSKAKIQLSEFRYDNKIFRFTVNQTIITFIYEFEKIVKNPKRELKHAIGDLPLDKVRPISATFQKIAINGLVNLLPSKIFVDNYDNYDNRYLCMMLYKIHQIVHYNSKFTIQQSNRLNAEIANIKQKIMELERPQIVDQEQVFSELRIYEQKVMDDESKWQLISSRLVYDKSAIYCSAKIELKYRDRKLVNTFWCNTNYYRCIVVPNINIAHQYCLITFPDSISQYLVEGSEFIIELSTDNHGVVRTGSGREYPKFNISNVRKIEGAEVEWYRNILKKQKQNIEVLKRHNWEYFAILSSVERKKLQVQRENQIKTLQNNIHKIENKIKTLIEYGNEIDQFKPYLDKLLNSDFVKNINFKKLVRVQPSMTYIQNTQYRNALKYYKEILNVEGIDVSVFELFEEISNYGIREMPQVYELWSLISIIKILENTFSYRHSEKDLRQLVNCISPLNKKIEKYVKINFSGSLNGRSIVLHYQKVLSNEKRPDFLLEITCNKRKIFVVLDAKFKNYNYKKSVVYETISMVNKYKENSDYFVFILHPCKDVTRKKFTSKLTNFGGEKIYLDSGQELLPFHEFGYLMIKPNEVDNLKKIIGMSLEYLIESKKNVRQVDNLNDPDPQYEVFCLGCGGEKVNKIQFRIGRNRYYYSCECENQDCGHNIHIDYCWNCRTRLFKHGSYWDYHRTSVWSIFDIHCPYCSLTVADRPNTN